MKQFLLGLSVSVAFIAGCAVATIAQSRAVPSARAEGPVGGTRWEYMCDWPGNQKMAERTTARMNEFGAEGWESIAGNGCFKRPLE